MRHDRLAPVAGFDVLAADHARNLDPLASHPLEALLQARALGGAGRVRPDGLVIGVREPEDPWGGHRRHSISVQVVPYEIQGWGVGELYFVEDRLVYHELPRAGSAEN